MRTLHLTLPVVAALFLRGPSARADDLLPPDRPIEEVVDHYLDALLNEEGIPPAAQADDATLVRRLTLDLVGRIPTAAEAQAFVAAADPGKRLHLVERLLASPGYARHQANEFDALLAGGERGSIRDYLLRASRDNRPWDQVFRELILPDEKDPRTKGASGFLRARVRDLDKLTAEVSALFFGVNVSCAQCHDHPLVADWKQDHFYGMKAFFSGTYEAGGFLAERASGPVKFKTAKGQERQAPLMFLTGKVIDDPAFRAAPPPEPKAKVRKEAGKGKLQAPPAPPKVSGRARFVEVALEPGQRDFFARAAVNRVWHRLFGHGLVMPLDQMHSENPPSHPELLAWLARDLEEHGYDLRRLTRGLVLSRAYARASRWEQPGEAPRPHTFAVARVRPLTPMQLATSLRLATADPLALSAEIKPEELERRVEQMENAARPFARLLDQPGDDFQVGVGEALLFSNGAQVQRELLAPGGDRLVGRLEHTPDVNGLVELAVRNVFSRATTPEERQALGEYLARRPDRRGEACKQVVWALLTSPELRFNH